MKNIACFLLLVFVLASCGSDEEPQQSGSLEGRWELQSATVNGNTTDRLRNLYFVFLPDSSLQTNLMGSEANYKYKLDEKRITQFSDPEVIYDMQSLSDSALVLETEIQGATFNILLSRKQPSSTIEPPSVESDELSTD